MLTNIAGGNWFKQGSSSQMTVGQLYEKFVNKDKKTVA